LKLVAGFQTSGGRSSRHSTRGVLWDGESEAEDWNANDGTTRIMANKVPATVLIGDFIGLTAIF
jgi:hypothetical protein